MSVHTIVCRIALYLTPVLSSGPVFLTGASLHAQRLDWKPEDIRPLTSLPWLDARSQSLDAVLDEIFHEPIPEIRYPVLAGYLSLIPVDQLDEAFEKCVVLEGTQTPNLLVEFLLRVWAQRDPRACWAKTKTLFELVGIEHGFLKYDSYVDRAKITVQNHDAVRASRYWIDQPAALLGFITGLQRSALPEEERVRLMKECADFWFARFKTWPDHAMPDYYRSGGFDSKGKLAGVLRPLEFGLEELRQYPIYSRRDKEDREEEALSEMVLRCWLMKEPKAGVEIVRKVQAQGRAFAEAREGEGGVGYRRSFIFGPLPSRSWLHLWRSLDQDAMLQWANSAQDVNDPAMRAARGMLLSRVDDRTRNAWLKAAEASNDPEAFSDLLQEWSIWDPQAAMQAALGTGVAYHAFVVQAGAARGFVPLNVCHGNFSVIRDFDVNVLRARHSDDELYDWATESMERWGEIDVGEAARYGLDGLMKLRFFPRIDLISFFKGQSNEFTDTGDMIDRTFCCLRVWAVVRPDEMKVWIATIQDPAMRDALTFILEHPWGTGENAEE